MGKEDTDDSFGGVVPAAAADLPGAVGETLTASGTPEKDGSTYFGVASDD